MEESQFWTIIEGARSGADGDPEGTAEGVLGQLTELAPTEIESFARILRAKVAAGYSWKLWGAAYLLNGGCSDDGFEYFRGWLVAQGQKVYEAALANPDSLVPFADHEDDYHECEDLLHAPMRAYKSVTGAQLPIRQGETRQAAEPSGENWDFDDQEATARQLPRLARKHNR